MRRLRIRIQLATNDGGEGKKSGDEEKSAEVEDVGKGERDIIERGSKNLFSEESVRGEGLDREGAKENIFKLSN